MEENIYRVLISPRPTAPWKIRLYFSVLCHSSLQRRKNIKNAQFYYYITTSIANNINNMNSNKHTPCNKILCCMYNQRTLLYFKYEHHQPPFLCPMCFHTNRETFSFCEYKHVRFSPITISERLVHLKQKNLWKRKWNRMLVFVAHTHENSLPYWYKKRKKKHTRDTKPK